MLSFEYTWNSLLWIRISPTFLFNILLSISAFRTFILISLSPFFKIVHAPGVGDRPLIFPTISFAGLFQFILVFSLDSLGAIFKFLAIITCFDAFKVFVATPLIVFTSSFDPIEDNFKYNEPKSSS